LVKTIAIRSILTVETPDYIPLYAAGGIVCRQDLPKTKGLL